MGQVTVTLNGRTYRLRCGEGEERRLAELADHVGQRVEQLARQFGQYGDERLLVMAALLITDDMLDLKSRLDEREGGSPTWADAAAEIAQPEQPPDQQLPEDVFAQSMPLEVALTSAIETPTEPDQPKPRPVLRRGSLEARLAQARVGATPKTGA